MRTTQPVGARPLKSVTILNLLGSSEGLKQNKVILTLLIFNNFDALAEKIRKSYFGAWT